VLCLTAVSSSKIKNWPDNLLMTDKSFCSCNVTMHIIFDFSIKKYQTTNIFLRLFWVAETYIAVCCTQSLSMAIFWTQSSVATHLRCGGMFNSDCCKFTSESVNERILKISIWRSYGQKSCPAFLTHRGCILYADTVLQCNTLYIGLPYALRHDRQLCDKNLMAMIKDEMAGCLKLAYMKCVLHTDRRWTLSAIQPPTGRCRFSFVVSSHFKVSVCERNIRDTNSVLKHSSETRERVPA